MKIKAVQKFLVASPRKLREIVPVVKSLKPIDAIVRLPFLGKRASEPLRKVIKSAIANAKQRGLKEDELTFDEIQINEGPRLKRWRAGARGRAKPYRRRMSHIRVVLTTEEGIPDKKLATQKTQISSLRTQKRRGGKTRTESVQSVEKSA